MSRRPQRGIDHTGQRFGRLRVIEYAGQDKHRRAMWRCQCDCGTVTVTAGVNLRKRDTRSCGCYQRELAPGLTRDADGSVTRLYRIWAGMRSRCLALSNEDYSYYGGRGISICREWNEFSVFRAWALRNGYKPHLTLDRINNDGNYHPDNCRWATRRVQARNRRFRTITHGNETRTVREWAEYAGIPYHTFRRRLHEGWTMSRALTQPVEIHKPADPELRVELRETHMEEVPA